MPLIKAKNVVSNLIIHLFFSLLLPPRESRFDDTDEYEQYESNNIDLLESQIDDCSNEWWS